MTIADKLREVRGIVESLPCNCEVIDTVQFGYCDRCHALAALPDPESVGVVSYDMHMQVREERDELAAALAKAKVALELLAPGLRHITTGYAEINEGMIAVDKALGEEGP